MTRRTFLRLLAGIAILVLMTLVIRFSLHRIMDPVSGNYISEEKLQELKQKAAAGDPAAQYTLTLFVDITQGEVLMKKSAEAGYPPAVVTYADMMENKEGSAQARTMLEKTAKDGYYPAIKMLTHCIARGSCGAASQKDALLWATVSRLLVEDNKLRTNELSEDEQQLLVGLTSDELKAAQSEAKSIADKITKVTND